ncbi:hypothetical protein GP5015_866 [gamma proteobacterium HTCC5015]|nr:hypothetical protein GP5015_866 [gamma proteobacterium HTCC5015]
MERDHQLSMVKCNTHAPISDISTKEKGQKTQHRNRKNNN